MANVQHGTLEPHPDGTFKYTPTAGYTGSDSFSVNYTDPLGAASSNVTILLSVYNNQPYAYANQTSFSVAHDHVLNVTQPAIYAYDSDGDLVRP